MWHHCAAQHVKLSTKTPLNTVRVKDLYKMQLKVQFAEDTETLQELCRVLLGSHEEQHDRESDKSTKI